MSVSRALHIQLEQREPRRRLALRAVALAVTTAAALCTVALARPVPAVADSMVDEVEQAIEVYGPAGDARTGAATDTDDPDAFIEGLIRALASASEEPRPISLHDAIRSAVGNNPGIVASSRIPDSVREEILEALAAYEVSIDLDSGYTKNKVPTSDILLGVGVLGTLESDEYDANLGVSKQLRTGAQLGLRWQNLRRTSNSNRQIFSPRFDTTVGMRIQQPLLDNFGGIDARTTVMVSENSSHRAVADFESLLADFVTNVTIAYWNYSLAQADLDVARHSLKLADELVDDARARVEVGTLPPVAIKEAQADAAGREEQVIAASNELDLAARTLQYAVMFGLDSVGAPLPVKPIQAHTVEKLGLDRAVSLRMAVDKRSEVRAARLLVDSARLEQRRSRNKLLPSLDVVGSYELVGLGGRESVDVFPGPDQFTDEVDAYGESIDALTSRDFFRYSVGLQLDIPLANASARSQHTQAEIELRRSRDDLRQVVSDIALEIEDAVGDVASAYKRVSAARLARELAEENLDNQQKRFDVGMVTTTDILIFQDNLATAMAAEARAIFDHAVAATTLLRAEGTLLENHGIDVRYEDTPKRPWWARF